MAEDDAFSKIDYSDLDATSRSVMEANAKSQGMSGKEYYESRGGVNKAGYYGDSYKEGVTLNDKEYFDVLNKAIESGLTGGSIGGAINAASQAKREAFKKKMGFTSDDQLNAYLRGTTEDFEKYWRQQDEAEARRARLKQRAAYAEAGVDLPPYTVPPTIPPSSNNSPITQTPPPPPVKTAPIDTILFDDDAVPIEIMADLIFENIGGHELINIARNDTVNGQQVIYQPIKNLTKIQQEYNPNNIVALQATSDKYFENFAIKFDVKVPETGTGENGAHVYIDPATGSLVVEAINLDSDEQIELEISTSGTIYEAEI